MDMKLDSVSTLYTRQQGMKVIALFSVPYSTDNRGVDHMLNSRVLCLTGSRSLVLNLEFE